MKKRREIDRTGREVTAIGLGAMPLSLAGRPDEDQAIAVIKAFIDGGGDFIDTANVYCVDDTDIGHNERLIAKALRLLGKTTKVTVATKGGLRRPRGGWTVDASPAWLRASCERSLRDLGTDIIFLYQLHAPDPAVPLADSVGCLAGLREEGKIQHIGLSNVSPEELETALRITSVASVQNKCSVFKKKALHNGLVELCGQRDITFIPHSPVGGHFDRHRLAQDAALMEIARAHATTPQCVALVWLLHLGDHVIPIPGASRLASIQSSLSALDLELNRAEIDRLSALPDWP
jgi:aryl-alcohol dehydrogenase-like predicted oxidoreductase